jgi:hypothetical protein
MKKFVFAVAAVLALAPLAAMAPASAAVARPASAAADPTCTGDHPQVIIGNAVGQWYTPSGTVNDAASNQTIFCVLAEGTYENNDVFELRQEGTSGCATYDANDNNEVMIENCDSTEASQLWQISHPAQDDGSMWTEYNLKLGTGVVSGSGGDKPIVFNGTSDGWVICPNLSTCPPDVGL